MSSSDSLLFQAHSGDLYVDVLAQLSKIRSVKRYLEIGVCGGRTFANVHCENALGVDPEFQLNSNIMLGKTQATLFQMCSDAFFRDVDVINQLGGPADLVFLDGMHLFEYLLRDFYNAEKICSKNAIIAMHDCLPPTINMTNRDHKAAKEMSRGSSHENWWTGDVWKIVPILRKHRPDLKLILVDAPPTGLVFVTNLDPFSDHLSNAYLDIVEEFRELEINEQFAADLKDNNMILSTASIISGFENSLYFRA